MSPGHLVQEAIRDHCCERLNSLPASSLAIVLLYTVAKGTVLKIQVGKVAPALNISPGSCSQSLGMKCNVLQWPTAVPARDHKPRPSPPPGSAQCYLSQCRRAFLVHPATRIPHCPHSLYPLPALFSFIAFRAM